MSTTFTPFPTDVASTLAPARAKGAGENWDGLNGFADSWITPDGARLYVPKDFDGQQSTQPVSFASVTQTCDFAVSAVWPLVPFTDLHISPTGAVDGRACTLTIILQFPGTGAWNISFDASVIFLDGQPVFDTSAGAITILELLSINGGLSWLAAVKSSSPTGTTTTVSGDAPQTFFAATAPNQVIDMRQGSYVFNQTQNTIYTFTGIDPTLDQEVLVRILGGHTATFMGVSWHDGPLGGGSTSDTSLAPLQSSFATIEFATANIGFGGLVTGVTTLAAPRPPTPPLNLAAVPTTTTLAVTWQTPQLTGDDSAAIDHYTANVYLHGSGSAIGSAHTITLPATLTTTFTGLTANTSYDVKITAHTAAHGDGDIATLTVSTLTSIAGVPGPPTALTATADPLSTTITWGPPTSNGGATVTGSKLTVTGAAKGVPNIVQTIRKVGSGNSCANLAADWGSNLTVGNKLIIVTSDTSGVGTRNVTSSTGQPAFYLSNDNQLDAHITVYDRDITATDGKPIITFTNTGGTNSVGSCTMTIMEVAGLGARDTNAIAQGPHRSGFQHIQSGHTGIPAQADEWFLAAFVAALTVPSGAYVLDDGTPLDSSLTPDSAFSDTGTVGWTALTPNNAQLFVAATHVTSGTVAQSIAVKYSTTCNGIGLIAAWKSGVGSFSFTNNSATSPTTVALPADGVQYTVSVKETNSVGDSTAATTTVFRQTSTGGGGGQTAIARTRGIIAFNGNPKQPDWTNENGLISALTPVGSMSMSFIFQGVAGLASSPGEATAWGDWQFFATAGATPRPAIFIYLADVGLIQQPGAGVSLADMAGASPSGTAAQQNAYNRMNAIASYFNHPEVIAQNPIFRLGWEMDQGWNEWTAVGNATNFLNAYRKAHDIIKAQCPTALFDLNVSSGCSAGAFAWNTASTAFWDSFYPGSAYVDIIGLDIYADLPISLFANETARINFVNAQLAAFQAWAVSKGKPISVPEWGIADPSFYTGVDTFYSNGQQLTSSNVPVNGSTFVDLLYTWMAALPASGAGSLYYENVFDGYAAPTGKNTPQYAPSSTGGRGLRNVPVYGTAAANEYKLRFSGG